MRILLYALLCYASITPISIHAVHTTQKASPLLVPICCPGRHADISYLSHFCNAASRSCNTCDITAPLIEAIEKNDLDTLAYICHYTRPASRCLDCYDNEGRQPLSEAIKLNRPECVSVLLAHGASATEKIRSDWKLGSHTVAIPPLLLATQQANSIIMALLLQHGASPYSRKKTLIRDKADKHWLKAESSFSHALWNNTLDLLLCYSNPPKHENKNQHNVMYGIPYSKPARVSTWPSSGWPLSDSRERTLYENSSLLLEAFACESTEPLKALLAWGADPNTPCGNHKKYPLDLVEAIVRETAPEHEQDARIKAIYKVLLRYGARECKTISVLRDIALDELIEKYEIKLGIKGEACTICLPVCGHYASSAAP